jgi:hypothetical protein
MYRKRDSPTTTIRQSDQKQDKRQWNDTHTTVTRITLIKEHPKVGTLVVLGRRIGSLPFRYKNFPMKNAGPTCARSKLEAKKGWPSKLFKNRIFRLLNGHRLIFNGENDLTACSDDDEGPVQSLSFSKRNLFICSRVRTRHVGSPFFFVDISTVARRKLLLECMIRRVPLGNAN